MNNMELLDLISQIGRELQSRMTFSDIDAYFESHDIDTTGIEPSQNSKWVYVKEVLPNESEDKILKIARELDMDMSEFEDIIEIENTFLETGEMNENFIEEQITKCQKKIREGDYDGAITNARSLLEAILTGIEERLVENPPDYDGKLNRLFNRVRDQLNLDPSREDISDRLREILSGLISIVSGMAGLRNKMSDAHVRTYKPDKHHAKLAVNAVNTVCDFLFETYEYQMEKGLIEV